ncbi:hypothetical protein SHELI_v1c02240 [Spiroplasma helicoides]|uniref:Uncharacterized protein n=1 Tax=Spiroplasma helicoides TaxID=216938 RepID=A0A1B3SJR9_9MOLU|nr:hypothetical protein [Spiroplasma helicoides]AOG60179.1 hypothetical protein SHELI_v1c02240 [Spiroplasma helicoides]
MRELSSKEKHKIIGGAATQGITAAALKEVGSIIKSGFTFIENAITNIAGIVYLFKNEDFIRKSDKFEMHLGSFSFKVDNSQTNKLDKEIAYATSNHVVNIEPPVLS